MGNHQAVTKEVVVVAGMMLILYDETHLGKDGEVKVLLFGELQELVAKLRAVA